MAFLLVLFFGFVLGAVLVYSMVTANEQRLDQILNFSCYAGLSAVSWAFGRFSRLP